MPANEYRFVTVWEVEGSPDEDLAILDDPADLVRWWPLVYLDDEVEDPGDERGVGNVVRLLTKGWLPYWLRWYFQVTEKTQPTRIALAAWGDLDGPGEWTGRSPRTGRWSGPRATDTSERISRCSGTCRSDSSRSLRRTTAGRWPGARRA